MLLSARTCTATFRQKCKTASAVFLAPKFSCVGSNLMVTEDEPTASGTELWQTPGHPFWGELARSQEATPYSLPMAAGSPPRPRQRLICWVLS